MTSILVRLLTLLRTKTRLSANTERMCSVRVSRNWKK